MNIGCVTQSFSRRGFHCCRTRGVLWATLLLTVTRGAKKQCSLRITSLS